MKTIQWFALAFLVSSFFFISCDKEDDDDNNMGRMMDSNYNPEINAENFADSVTNVFFPLVPGTVFTYESDTEDGLETDVVTVLSETKMIMHVRCTVVHDVVSIDGEVIEDTYDWFAQDLDGNVWYMGEDVSNYDEGQLEDKEGSFEAGVDGAKPGIMMHADPVLEMPYRQEYYFNHAEDFGKVVARNVTVTTTFGTFQQCLKTADWNALEPDSPMEFKYYAPHVGLVKEESANGETVLDLIDWSHGES